MTKRWMAVAATLIAMAAGDVMAQAGGDGGKGPGAPPAVKPNTGPGPGGGMGPGRGMRAGPNNTMGWSMMTPAERQAHRDRMRGFTSYDECVAYRDRHHQEMVARARDRGMAAPGEPRRDVCAGLRR